MSTYHSSSSRARGAVSKTGIDAVTLTSANTWYTMPGTPYVADSDNDGITAHTDGLQFSRSGTYAVTCQSTERDTSGLGGNVDTRLAHYRGSTLIEGGSATGEAMTSSYRCISSQIVVQAQAGDHVVVQHSCAGALRVMSSYGIVMVAV